MTEHGMETNGERLAAHERMSTGALASWMRACASHPWRVVFAWLGIIAVLVVLVATAGGSLKDRDRNGASFNGGLASVFRGF